jgi:hypothetical protein
MVSHKFVCNFLQMFLISKVKYELYDFTKKGNRFIVGFCRSRSTFMMYKFLAILSDALLTITWKNSQLCIT